jgi:DNA repair photolyase
VLLASPILKALRGRVSVSVAIETVDDNLSSELTPLLPKPSERILTLRTLTSLGIPTFAQICPITSARAKARDTKLLAAVGAMASYVKLLSGLDAIGFTFSSKHLYRSNYELCRQINHSLNKIMPKRVIWIKDLIATTNQAAA